jgi:hypothetical protein
MSDESQIEQLKTEEKIREILQGAAVLRDEAAQTRDRTEDLIQASYWSGRANALAELITRFREAGL